MDQREYRAMFTTRGGVDPEAHIIVHYRLTPADGMSLEEAAARVAVITSLRTIERMPYETPQARLEEAGKVVAAHATGQVEIAYPTELCTQFEGLAQLIALMTSGAEYDYTKDFWVDDIELPRSVLSRFPGPKFGGPGIRARFGIPSRPIVGAILKPRRGAPLSEIARLAFEALVGGADFIADDLLMVDPPGEMAFSNRVPRFADLARKASDRTGEKKLYIANVGTSALRALEMAQYAESVGVGGLTINAWAMGFSSAQEFCASPDLNTPIITCNMGCGILTRPARRATSIVTGVSEVVISKLCRIAGTDGVHAGTSDSECFGQDAWGPSVLALRSKLLHLRSSCAVAEGDLTVADVWANVASLGPDIMLEPCSGILAYPGGPRRGGAAFRTLAEALHWEMTSDEATATVLALTKKDANLRAGMEHYGFSPRQ